jgi:hypothetical protein
MLKRHFFLSLLAGSAALLLATVSGAAPANTEWKPLLDRNLSQWTPFLGVPDPSIEVPGYTYEKGKPVGLRDPNGVYSIRLLDDEPVLHVSGEIFGGLTSNESFSNYHVRFQFRWGTKKYPPRANAKKRDGGFVFHAIGEHAFFFKTWKHAAQFQIQETDVGDFFPLFENKAFKSDVPFANGRYTPGAPLQTRTGGVTHSADAVEKPSGEWNSVELIAVGADAVQILNGKVVNVLRNLRYVDVKSGDLKKEIPLTGGQFQIQSEGAEMDFRRIEIRSLTEIPKEYAEAITAK